MTQLELVPANARTGDLKQTKPALDVRNLRVPCGPGTILLVAAWFGLIAGVLELAVLLVNREILRRVVLDWLRLNHHALWMVPGANLGLLMLVGLLFAAASRFTGRRAYAGALVALGSLTALAPLLAAHRLQPLACVLLAAGVGVRVGMVNEKRARRLQRIVRLTLPGLAVLTAAWCAYHYFRVAGAEERALAGLPLAAPDSPNVLLIALDTVRADHLSSYGYNRQTTPRLDALARSGVQFDRALSPADWTLPAHASLFSGRWHSQLTASADRRLDSTYPVLAEFLRDHGYATAGFVGNIANCNNAYGFDRGFTHYEDIPEKARVTPLEVLNCSELGRSLLRITGLADEADVESSSTRKNAPEINQSFLTWVEHQQGRPFFAFLNYFDAHDPFILPDGVTAQYGPAKRSQEQEDVLSHWAHPNRGALPPDQATLIRDAYDDGLAYLDSQVGCLLDALRQRGLLENTIVVVTADHGESLGEHDLYSHGRSLYQTEIHVPLLVVAPRTVPAGRRVATTTTLRDVPATVAELAGLGATSPFPGNSLARHWRNGDEAEANDETPILSEVFIRSAPGGPDWLAPALRSPMRAVTIGDHKYIWCGDGTEEFYNLADDPGETRNLARSADLRPFRAALKGGRTPHAARQASAEPPNARERADTERDIASLQGGGE